MVSSGVNRAAAEAFVNRALNLSEQKASIFTSFFSTISVWIIILIAFALFNVVLYIAQELYHRKDVQKAQVMESHLEQLKGKIDMAKENINAMVHTKKEIEKVELKLKSPDTYYATQESYTLDYDRYNTMIDVYNAERDSSRNMISQYDALVKEYNLGVDEYNELVKKANSRWYIIPIPGIHGKSFTKHH